MRRMAGISGLLAMGAMVCAVGLYAAEPVERVTDAQTISGNGAWSFEDVEGVDERTVTVTKTSSPSSFVVNNTRTDYVIKAKGSESIDGSPGLVKSGSGTLRFVGIYNTFSGGITIKGGTVVENGAISFKAWLGTGQGVNKYGNKIRLENGALDLNGSRNYSGSTVSTVPTHSWLSMETLTLGGQAGGVMELRNGSFGIYNTLGIEYDATNNPGTATFAAAYDATNDGATQEFRIGDSSATDTEIDFTGGLHVEEFSTWANGKNTTIEKTGAGTMQLSSKFGFPALKVTGGTVRMNETEGFLRTSLALNGGTLDLNGRNQTVRALSGESGTVTSAAPAELMVTEASTYGGKLSGAVTLIVQAPLALTGEIANDVAFVVDGEAFAGMADGTSQIVLTLPSAVGAERVQWRGLEASPHLSWTYDEATGTWSLASNRASIDNFIVMPMGDSITEGSADFSSYRKALAKLMVEAGMKPRFVGARPYKSGAIADEDCKFHTGLSGQRVQTVATEGGLGGSGFLQGATNWLEQAGYPDAVTLMIGTNDRTTATGEEAEADAERTFGYWKAMVGQMVAMRPNTWFIVAPIVPSRSDVVSKNAFTEAYNKRIKSLFTLTTSMVEANGEAVPCVLGTLNDEGGKVFGASAKIIMASMYDALPTQSNTAYYYDDTHPNQKGYDRMAAVWLAAIKTLAAMKGGLKDAEAIVDAYPTAGAMDRITAVFNQEQRESEGVTLTIGGEPVEPASVERSADGRRLTFALAKPVADGAEVTVTKQGAPSRTFIAKEKSAESRVDSALTEGYVKVKTLDVPAKGSYNTLERIQEAFSTEDAAETVTDFGRMGYYVTLARPDGDLRWLWVTMDRPAAYDTVEKLGLPTSVLRTKVENLRVASNVPGIEPVTEDGVQGLLQFGPYEFGQAAADNAHPVSLGKIYDWNSSFLNTKMAYGAMQVFRLYKEGIGRADSGMPASTLFAYNRWSYAGDSTSDEIVLGDLANHVYYDNAHLAASLTGVMTSSFPTLNATAYSVRRIEIWVRPTATRTWGGATEGTWDTAEASVWKEGKPFANGDTAVFGEASTATVTVGGAVAPSSLAVTQGAYTFTGAPIATASLTVAAGATATFRAPLAATAAQVEGTLAICSEGNVEALTFAAGATLVAGNGTLTLTKGYVKTGVGAVTVALPEGKALARGDAVPVLTVGEGKVPDVADFAAAEGLTLQVEGSTLFVANLLAIERPEEAEVAWSSEAMEAITAAVDALPSGHAITRVTKVEAVTKGGAEKTRDVAIINDVQACFKGGVLATANADATATVTVNYEFGVTGISYDASQDTFLIAVRVNGSAVAPVTFAPGVTLELRAADEPEGASPLASQVITDSGVSEVTLPLKVGLETCRFRARAVR